MKRLGRAICVLSALFLISALVFTSDAQTISVMPETAKSSQTLPDDIDFWSDYPADILSKTIAERMTDEELLSQIFMFGWAGAEPSALLNAWVSDRGLGSVKVFGWNTDDIHQVARSVKSLQERAATRRFKIPLFVATDQEGGWIRHVKGETTDTPGNMAIGASGYPLDAYYSGFYINREIKALGINMNFAPTVDIYSNLDSSVIGPRSFGSDPEKVGILGEAFAKGSMDAGVIPTAKHFPGHGDTDVDSHGRLPQINISYEELMNRELVPFRYLIAAGIPAVMSGHLEFPQIQENGIPSSLSKKFLTDILRGQLGYDGLIITDDMMMNGATLYTGTLYLAFQMAIEAGNDIILSSTTAGLNDALWTRNLALMKSDEDFKERVKDAARRVLKAKMEYFKGGNAAPLYPNADTIDLYIPDREGQQFFFEEACRAVSVYKAGDFPYHPKEGERILIAGPFLSLYSEGRKRYPTARTFHFSYELAADQSNYDEWNGTNFVNVASGYDTIIINVFNEHTANIARRLRYMGKKVIILSIMSPVPVLDFDWADTVLCGYSYSDFSFKALFAALNGEIECEGEIPLDQIK